MKNVLEWLETTVEKYPDKPAFSDTECSITFAQVYDIARNTGAYLIEQLGVDRTPVAVFAGRKMVTPAYFLGVVYAGRPYAPIDASLPDKRIEKILEREIATILFDSAHNDKLKFISITKVSLTKDLSIATVYYTVLGNQGEIESTKKEFENAKGYIRSELAKRIDLRKTPELRLKYDESLAYGNRISEILNNLKK